MGKWEETKEAYFGSEHQERKLTPEEKTILKELKVLVKYLITLCGGNEDG